MHSSWIGIVGAAAFVVEGGIESWSALFLEQQLHAEPSVSGLGPGVFGASMAAGRFFGQAAHRISDRALLAGGGAVSAVGCVIAATAPNAPLALVGFAIGGAGISLNAPIVFGRRPGRKAASAVATVTTLGYVGLLVGPPLVGGIAQATTCARRSSRSRWSRPRCRRARRGCGSTDAPERRSHIVTDLRRDRATIAKGHFRG